MKKEFTETKETKQLDALIKKLYKSERYVLTVIKKADEKGMQSIQLIRNCNSQIVMLVADNIRNSVKQRVTGGLADSLGELLKEIEKMTGSTTEKKAKKVSKKTKK